MNIRYNSWIDTFKEPFGALKVGEELKISVEADSSVSNIWLVIEENNNTERIELKRENEGIFSAKLNLFNKPNTYFYYFEVKQVYDNNEIISYYGKTKDNGESYKYNDLAELEKYQLTVSKEFKTPDWFKEGILYHVFVDRFNNGNRAGKIENPKKNSFIYANWDDDPMYIKDANGDIVRWDFFGGNLKGIISKLSYLKTLGVTILYLSPIFESSSNHKYDTGNYKKIDPMFGDEKIFDDLIKEAKKQGIDIILDGVFSHTGDDSIYFNRYNNYDSLGAYQSEESPYRSWYNFKDDESKSYDCWWGIKALPNVNELEKSYMNYIIHDNDSVLKTWMNKGIKGWRLDVADELPSQFIKDFKNEMTKIDEESILIGEVWEDASNKVSYEERREYFLGDQLDSVTGYLFRDSIIDFLNGKITNTETYNKFMTIMENYPKESFKSNLNILGTHDVRRILTELNEDKDLLKLAVAMQMTFEGVPYIYYGDEAGMLGEKDPHNRKTYPWKNEDKDLINFYKKLIKIRKQNKELTLGDTKLLNIDNGIFGYIRSYNNQEILVLINKENETKEVSINLESNLNSAEDIFEKKSIELVENKLNISLESRLFKIIKLK